MNGIGQYFFFWFVDEPMYVLGHDNVSINAHSETSSHGFEAKEEQIAGGWRGKVTIAVETGEGNKMRLSGVVVAPQTAGHSTGYALRARNAVTSPRLAQQGGEPGPPVRL